jgi:hypothetical protein
MYYVVTSERHIKNLAGKKALGVGHLVDGKDGLLRGGELLRDGGDGAPLRHDVGVVHDGLSPDGVAAAGHGDPELLADGDLVGVGDVVGGGDLLERDEAAEDALGNGVERVPRADAVRGALERGADAAGAEAGQAHAHRGRRGGGGRRGRRQAVSRQQAAVRAELEDGAHGGERRGGAVGRGVEDERLACVGPRRGGVAREPRRARRGGKRGEEEAEEGERRCHSRCGHGSSFSPRLGLAREEYSDEGSECARYYAPVLGVAWLGQFKCLGGRIGAEVGE